MEVSALRDLLASWANINSGSRNSAGLDRMCAALTREFSTLPGARVEAVPLPGTSACALRVVVRAKAPLQLLFSGHYDTVYAEDHHFQRCTLINEQTLRGPGAGRDPEAGRNAILALAEYLQQVHVLNGQLDGVMLNIGNIRGGGAVNIVPDLAEAEVNVRITRMSDEAAVTSRLHELARPINSREGYRLEISGRFNRLPKEVTLFEENLFATWQACGRERGVNFSWQHVGGGSDGNLLSAAGLPNLDGLGPVGDHLHSAEEFVHLPSLVERAGVAAHFLEKLAAGEIAIGLPGNA